jgi:hypothetical protein
MRRLEEGKYVLRCANGSKPIYSGDRPSRWEPKDGEGYHWKTGRNEGCERGARTRHGIDGNSFRDGRLH